jgi:redox-sensitive bicupin YhaK (pirin superfamily)
MKSILHKAETRGHANHGWLDTWHTFSFANYYNPERIHFGTLRVLNDDTIDGGMGFGMHPHDNMEIITIPLEGDLEHKDSMGNTSVIKHGEVQVMSAGTGIYHSEFNAIRDKPVSLLQIWVFPNKQNVTPRYDQIVIDTNKYHNALHQVLSPNPNDDGVWIYQNAWFHLGKFDKDFSAEYSLKVKENGIYTFVIDGKININGKELSKRDGLGLWEAESINIKATEASYFLLMEVPMIK